MHSRLSLSCSTVAVLALLAVSAASPGLAQSTISETDRYAYAANFGWIDGRPSSTDGVRLTGNVLSGWLYSANTGWISLGDGTPANGVAYANDSATDYGVNVAPTGALTGHAWSSTLGWLTFDATYGTPAVARSSGAFTGHVWVPNAGWISLGGFPSALVSTTRAEGLDTDVDGLPDYWEIQQFGGIAFTTGAADPDGDGVTQRDKYLELTGPFNFGGYTWTGGYTFAPNSISPIQNWSPRVPPETFVAFTSADVLNVNAPGALVVADGPLLNLRALNFNSDGGRLELLNFEARTNDGLNLLRGTMDISSSVITSGPVTTAASSTTRVHDGEGIFSNAAVTNAGTWQLDGASMRAHHFVNQGTFTLPSPQLIGSFYGHFEGRAGSYIAIDSGRAAPGESGWSPGTSNGFVGSLDWSGGGDLDIGTRSWTFFALYDRAPDATSQMQTNRFRLDGVDVSLAADAYFSVSASDPILYEKDDPQVELSNLTLTNAGTFHFRVDEIALRNLSVTGNPVEITAENSRTTRIREVTQAAGAPGTLRADAFGGFFALEQATLQNSIELTLGRAASATAVAIPDFVNNATLRIAGSTVYATSLTPPLADTPTSPLRTLSNNATLAFGPGTSTVAQRVVNTGNLTVATGADVALERPLENRASLTIASGGRLVSGVTPASPIDGPFLPVTWETGQIANQGEFTLRGTDLHYRASSVESFNQGQSNTIQSITSTGNLVTLEDSLLRLEYATNLPIISRFAFRNFNRVDTGGVAKALVVGSLWRVEPNSTLQLSSVVNAGTFELAGSANGTYPNAFLNPTAEFINTGLFRTVEVGGILQGLLVNFGQVEVTPGSRLTVYTPSQDPEAAVPGRLVNHEHANIHIAAGGTLQLSGGFTPTASVEILGGTLVNEGRFIIDYPTKFLFALGAITGNPVEVTNGTLQIDTFATAGTFLLHGPANTLALDPFHTEVSLAAGITLHLQGTEGTPSALTVNGDILDSGYLLQKGTFILDSTDDEPSIIGSATLSVGGTGQLLLANTGKLHLARAPGKNRARYLDCHVNGPGQIIFDDGIIAEVTKTEASWVSDGPFEFGLQSSLTFASDAVHFSTTTTSDLHGSGTITFPAAVPMQLLGKLRPEGLLRLAAASAAFSGKLVSLLRTTGVDRVAVDGTVNVTGARVEFGVEPGATLVSGTRYTVLSAASITGTLPTVTLDLKLAASHTALIDNNGTTLGVTLTARRTFATWADSFNLSGASVTSDADGDGLPLLLEYAFGLDPTRTDRSPLAVTMQTSPTGALVLTFPWHRSSLDFTWQAETSTTLATGSWSVPASVTTVITPHADPALATVTLTIPVTGPRNFARLVITPGTPPLD